MNIINRIARLFGTALVLSATLQAGSQAAETTPFKESSTNANGVKLHYLVAGQGTDTPVVLLHGYAETSHMWIPLIGQLADRRVVIAPDLPGEGGSAVPDTGYDKKTMAQDVHALVKAMGYRKIKIVGHDIGLMVAYAYAAQYPEEVESVTLMDAFLPGVGDWQKVWLLRDKWHFHFYGDTPLKLVAGRERIYFEHFWNDFAADPTHSVSEADRQLYAANYGQPGRMRAGFEYFHAFPQDAEDFAGFAKTPLTMPVQVLAGEKASGAFLVNQVQLVATNVQGKIIKGSGHWLMEEAPQETIQALVQFINAPSSK
ncbi:Pimeloyl-ACP methyl ester carboxylesterase [Collimonas sp. OK307]|uniref:alpha/beta fold hydrolase n=1 Tax=Collimonas sp. OK307 TaxID=1801620 RepID=UPI0008E0B219|nr:alpha/beta hydrolase [Collimonas sp. OK307]SFI32354.1 Pimeloyl-ACP methyl ester carboxylesterase [Collimonas sp. OK307]